METSTQIQRLYLVRHGERMDHAEPLFGRKTHRPHDSPLTDEGKEMAWTLGKYLLENRGVVPSAVIVLSSPLQRCVETAHNMILGMHLVPRRPDIPVEDQTKGITTPIFLEETLIEGPYWMAYDLRNHPQFGIRGAKWPQPLYHSPEFLQEHISALVQPLPLQGKPLHTIGLKEDPSTNKWVERDHIKERCARGARELVAAPQVAGKIVICVAHAETCVLWYRGLCSKGGETSPYYTGLAELIPNQDGSKMIVGMEPFSCPHLHMN